MFVKLPLNTIRRDLIILTSVKPIYSINRPTKRGKVKSPYDGQYQCQKEMNDHLLVCQQFLTESHIVTRLPNERT
jgi:hypothetical protein